MIVDADLADVYVAAGWWRRTTLSDRVRELAARSPDAEAFVTDADRWSWSRYDEVADRCCHGIVAAGLAPGDRLAVMMRDGPEVHAVYLGAERAGVVVVGIGARAGDAEIDHLLRQTSAEYLLTERTVHGDDARSRIAALVAQRGTPVRHHFVLDDLSGAPNVSCADRALGPNDLFFLNSTSGTTGLPQCVTQFQNRWFAFHEFAVDAGALSGDDVCMSVVPAPFGFGLWTQHFTPTLLGAPPVLMERFDADHALQLVARERVSVLAAVSTQFMMMLNSPLIDSLDLTGLRVLFTGGEAVPYHRAAEFEERTGASVLQFFGSNETGAFSRTTVRDDRDHRLRTAGRVIPEMHVRLFDDDGLDVTASGGPGQPAGRGPLTCAGYYRDDDANRSLMTPDGWMLMADLVTIDPDGYLRVVGRKTDLIIRGGKNISAAQVEEEVGTHPAVELVGVVAVPDPVFGERVCAAVVLRGGASLDLTELSGHLRSRGVTTELFPEYLLMFDDLPRNSGGKVAKAELRTLVLDRLAQERRA